MTAPTADEAAQIARELAGGNGTQTSSAGCAARAADGSWRSEAGGATGTFFDLASVTKPMTAVAVARAGLELGTPLGSLVAEARGTASEHVPIELFLAHRAGLAAHRTLFAPLLRGEAVDPSAALREAAAARRDDAPGRPPAAGFPPLYSDLGYVLAGEALARAVGARDAGEAIARLVVEPLGLDARLGTARDLARRADEGARRVFAPTEDVSWRGGVVEGVVHDENAWALTGSGGSGHAGMFGTIAAVLAFGMAVLDALALRGPLVPAVRGTASLDWLVRERAGGTLRAGFDGKSHQGSSAGDRLGPRSFGHLGFTGTSLWIDPDAEVVVALLTNRVFPTRENVAIRAARPRVHDALFERAVVLRSGA